MGLSIAGVLLLSAGMLLLGWIIGSMFGKKPNSDELRKKDQQLSASKVNIDSLEAKLTNLDKQAVKDKSDLVNARETIEQHGAEMKQMRSDYAAARSELDESKKVIDSLKATPPKDAKAQATIDEQIASANKANAELAEQKAINEKQANKLKALDEQLVNATNKLKSAETADTAKLLKELETYKLRWKHTNAHYKKNINNSVKRAKTDA